jgi:hypothetical protein
MPEKEETLHIRTKAKGSEFKDDLHHFTNKWTEVPIGRVRGEYLENPHLEVRDEKNSKKSLAEPSEVPSVMVAPDSDNSPNDDTT